MRSHFKRVLPVALLLAACSASRHRGQPTEASYSYMDAEIRWTRALEMLAAAREQGRIPKDAIPYIDLIINEGDKLLDDIHEQVDTQLKALRRDASGALEPGQKIVISAALESRMLTLLENLLVLASRYKA